MEIQLTKDKKVTLGGKRRKRRKKLDITGVDLVPIEGKGCPAVRIAEKKGVLRLLAAGYVPAPSDPVPDSWEAAAKSCIWTFPSQFQSPAAALAVSSPDIFVAQTTLSALKSDISSGTHNKQESSASAGSRRIGLRRDAKAAAAPQTSSAPADIADPKPGVPVSNGGTRFVMQPLEGSDGFILEAGLPEYQALWYSRLLPEGKRPTAVSIQPRQAALASSPILQKAFSEAGGDVIALFADSGLFCIAGYKRGSMVLLRECRAAGGMRGITDKLKRGLGLDDEMLLSALEGNLIDPRPVLDPLVAPIIDELSASKDYLSGKLGCEPKAVIVSGVNTGLSHWSAFCEERTRLKMSRLDVFEGLQGVPPQGNAGDFLAAAGAALAVLGSEEE